MTTITLNIDEKSKKGKYLLGLIKELAKEESTIKIMYDTPNLITQKAMEEAERGNVYNLENIEDLFDKD